VRTDTRHRARRRGFTLIEMAAVITVLAVVAGLGTSIVVEGGRVLSQTRARNDGFADAQYALQRLNLDVAGLANRDQVTAMNAHSITLVISGSSVTYALSGTTLRRGSRILAKDVTQFDLVYYQSDGSLATSAANLHRIGVEITVTRADRPASLRTEMFPRTFRGTYVPPGEDPVDTGVDGRGGRRWWWLGRLWRWGRWRHW